MVNVAVVGGGGYSGLELIRILDGHPGVTLRVVTSDKYAGRAVGGLFPGLDRVELSFSPHDASLSGCELAFLAVPDRVSLEKVPGLLEQGLRVVDLSGVFRLADGGVFTRHYGMEHTAPEALAEAVYGLPEAFRGEIPAARLVANPGCYPTGALLGLLPLGGLAGGLAGPPVIDAKSGVSGAGGRVENDSTSFMSLNENFKPYKLFSHQHTPEIEQYLAGLTGYDPESQGGVVFIPHLLPIARGILSTIHLRFVDPVEPDEMRRRYAAWAGREPFVTLLPEGGVVEVSMAQHGNRCLISLHHGGDLRQWVVVTAIDNLVKGAAGQAVQNMNLMCGLEETAGLE